MQQQEWTRGKKARMTSSFVSAFIQSNIYITYHVPSIKTVMKKIHVAPDLLELRVLLKNKLKMS